MMQNINVNYLAVLVAGIVNIGIGFLWHGPLFGKQWMALMGFNKNSMKSMKITAGQAMVGGFVAALVMSYVQAYIIGFSQAATFIEGVISGFWIWLGFVATVMIGKVLWEGKPFRLFAITSGYWLVTLMINGGILAVWR